MELYIIAGPNGVGKTTFATKFLPNYADCQNFVNADLIAQENVPLCTRSTRGSGWETSVQRNPKLCQASSLLCI